MDANGSGRRRFLKQAAAIAGVAAGAGAGAEWAARGDTKSEAPTKDGHVHETSRRGARFTIDHMTYYTPLQDYVGIITPASLHFMQYHASHLPNIDAAQHRLTVHGLVDRPTSFSIDDLKQMPSVSRIHFLECHANSSPMIHNAGNPNMGLPVQFIHGMTSCSE
jgi:sulfane dehydrogenase subunit SoxC